MQWDDRGWESIHQCQQAVCKRHPGSVSAVQEGRDGLGEVLTILPSLSFTRLLTSKVLSANKKSLTVWVLALELCSYVNKCYY